MSSAPCPCLQNCNSGQNNEEYRCRTHEDTNQDHSGKEGCMMLKGSERANEEMKGVKGEGMKGSFGLFLYTSNEENSI